MLYTYTTGNKKDGKTPRRRILSHTQQETTGLRDHRTFGLFFLSLVVLWSRGLVVPFLIFIAPVFGNTADFPGLEPRSQALLGFDLPGFTQDFSGRGVHGDGIAPRKYLLRPKQAQPGFQSAHPIVPLFEVMMRLLAQPLRFLAERLAPLIQAQGRAHPRQAVRQISPGQTLAPGPLPGAARQAGVEVVQKLQPVVEPAARMNPPKALRGLS